MNGSADTVGASTYFGTRSYDPSLGRWTQQDPVGGSLGDLNAANRYTYANDDPVNVVDPSGKGFIDCIYAGALLATALLFIAVGLTAIVAAASAAAAALGISGFGLAALLSLAVSNPAVGVPTLLALGAFLVTFIPLVIYTLQEVQSCFG